jgi:pimeloyl-ACP methyl ester carboxylesterase
MAVAGEEPGAQQVQLMRGCEQQGWQRVALQAAGRQRELVWKGPDGPWQRGTIIVLHGGGGTAYHFCAGPALVRPQQRFADMAIARGYGVFALEATDDAVTDDQGRACGKRFDFPDLPRQNLDLPYIEAVLTQVIPNRRPERSSSAVFMTGLSTGGYMAIHSATRFADRITAFAPISAGDPFHTRQDCDASLSPRKSAKGVLYDTRTGKRITEPGACDAATDRAAAGPSSGKTGAPAFKQFHHAGDAIVDISCMRQATAMLEDRRFHNAGPYVIDGDGRRRLLHHLWLERYNRPLLDFFDAAGAGLMH